GLGAARDPELLEKIGRATALEVAVTGIPWTFAPTLAVARDDRWGRSYESYSEDPEIVRAYAASMVRGIQGLPGSDEFLNSGHMLATAKHFLGDGGTRGGKDQGNTIATEQELFEIHGQGYVGALEAGVQTVMASFSSWNGQKMHGNRYLLTEILKERMGFDGFIVGDWNGHGQLPGCENESCAAAFNAGVDLFMAPEDWKALWHNTLAQAQSGEIPMERLDDAVRRILRVKLRAGLFEKGAPSTWPYAGKAEYMGSAEHRALAREAVRKSLVLLKNNGGLLPLDPGAKVLVTGPGADDIGMQSGGWTLSWQGTGNKNSDFPGATSIWQGIEAAVEAAGGQAVLSPDGRFEQRPDVAIVVWGESPYAEFQGDLNLLQYRPGDQRDLALLRTLQAEGIPVVSVFLSGRPLWVNPHINASDAFVAAWLPGSEGAGVADVLFTAPDGSPEYDFTGRLSFSWPGQADQGPLNAGEPGYDPLFALGYGLSGDSDTTVARLSEQGVSIESGSLADLDIFINRLSSPWALWTARRVDKSLATGFWYFERITDLEQAQFGEGFVRAQKADHRVQEDALRLTWPGSNGGIAGFGQDFEAIEEFSGNDLSGYLLAKGRLVFDMKLESRPPGRFELGLSCSLNTNGCGASYDLAAGFKDVPSNEWRTFSIDLGCFSEHGMDFTRTASPFVLFSDQPLELVLSDVRLVAGPFDNDADPCLPGGPDDW
ncbi:MAG TPA: glycoside hydrolase family 3 N-terminal domain-containing protein, partial [Xanthomonadales bacterium]|nr:glycoside hydrolase family 3 N-terminal domain-containing protein [Xanthomonadales bacterium]